MTDSNRLKFIDRLGRLPDITVSEASFIDSLDQLDSFTDSQRQRIDDMHARYKARLNPAKPGVKKGKPARFLRSYETEGKLNRCKKGHKPCAVQEDTSEAKWTAWCFCGGVTSDSSDALAAQWNCIHPIP